MVQACTKGLSKGYQKNFVSEFPILSALIYFQKALEFQNIPKSRITYKITSDVRLIASKNKYTAKNHTVSTEVARVTASNATVFFSPGN